MTTLQLHCENAEAKILVSQGFNCYSFRVAGQDLIWAAPEHSTGQCRPSGGGIPLLYPFPGRIAGGKLRWENQTYHLEAKDGKGNAIHGFAYDRPWRIKQQSDHYATAEFQLSIDAEDEVERWPSDFRIQATYELDSTSLTCYVDVENCGDKAMPSGFGAHPYFALPEGEQSIVQLPVSEHWELDEMLPTGVCEEVENAEAVRKGLPMSNLRLDDVFGGLIVDDDVEPAGRCYRSSVVGGDGRGVELTFGRPFREIVVYTPGDRQAICIEPYSCVPAAVSLGEMAGWTPLEPAATEHYEFRIAATVPGT